MIPANPTLNPENHCDPLARHLWGLLRDRSEIDRRHVFDVLQTRLGLGVLADKQEQAAEALRRFIDARAEEARRFSLGAPESGEGPNALPTGEPAPWSSGRPSRRNYDAFRAGRPEPSEWPSSSSIRKAFDNDWGAALGAVGHEPVADITSRRLISPKPFTKDEVLSVLRVWIADVDNEDGPDSPLKQKKYFDWEEQKSGGNDPRFLRAPSGPTIYKLIGDWKDVLVALGCAHRHWRAKKPTSTGADGLPVASEELAADFDLESAPPTPPRRGLQFDRGTPTAKAHADGVIAWLRWLADQLPEGQRAGLRVKDFDPYMASVRRVSLAQGKPLHPPSYVSFERSTEIDGWLHAKFLAGIVEGVVPAKRSTRAFSERELIDAVLAARRTFGPDISRAQYTRWREERLPKNGETGFRRLPSESLVRSRFADSGRWPTAMENVARRAAELGVDPATGGRDRGDSGLSEAA
jgi:hypothetical protein